VSRNPDGLSVIVDAARKHHGILRILHIPGRLAPAATPPDAGRHGRINQTPDGENTMSNIEALKQEKQALIDKMLEMQKQFIEHEHEHGVTGKDYWASSDGLLANYRQEYMDMANRVVDIAHEIVGSSRL
jgi:hypothetical protein